MIDRILLKVLVGMIVGLSVFQPLVAQRSTPTELRIDNLYPGEAVQAYDLRPRTMKGSLYYSDTPLKAAIKLENGKVMSGYNILYNLESDMLEVISGEEIYVLPGSMVAEFTLEEKAAPELVRFVRTTAMPGQHDVPDTHFLKYQVDGELSLLVGYEIEIYEPNYVPALDAGSLQSKAVKNERYFLYDGKKLEQIPQKKKEAYRLFTNYSPEAPEYMKAQNINFKKLEDLTQWVQHLNQQ